MPILSRSKMISFRLSAEEYDQFRELCFTQGIRSVSELARAAVNKLIQDPDPVHVRKEALESRVGNLEGQVQILTLELRRLKHPGSLPNARASAAGEGY